jgi:hypothetical protein
MADELSLLADISFNKTRVKVAKSYGKKVTVTGESYVSGTLSIGTSEEQVTQLADLGTPGYVLVINTDATNYVEIGSTTGVYDIKLKAGEFALYRHNSATMYAKANTADCIIQYFMFED